MKADRVKFIVSCCCYFFFIIGTLQAQIIEIDVDKKLESKSNESSVFYLLKETDTLLLKKDNNNKYPIPVKKEDSNKYISILWETENYYYEANVGNNIFAMCSLEFYTKKTSGSKKINKIIFNFKHVIPSYSCSFCSNSISAMGLIRLHKKDKKRSK